MEYDQYKGHCCLEGEKGKLLSRYFTWTSWLQNKLAYKIQWRVRNRLQRHSCGSAGQQNRNRGRVKVCRRRRHGDSLCKGINADWWEKLYHEAKAGRHAQFYKVWHCMLQKRLQGCAWGIKSKIHLEFALLSRNRNNNIYAENIIHHFKWDISVIVIQHILNAF